MSASRRKGTRFESEVCAYLRGRGHGTVERRALGGARDRGDVAGLSGWTIECKATRELDLAGAVDEARVEAGHAGTSRFAAVIKRRMRGVEQAYVVLPLSIFAEVVAELAGREPS